MKKIITILSLLAIVAGFLFVAVHALDANHIQAVTTPTPSAVPIAIPAPTPPARTCIVATGIEGGTVNLRACPGAACGAVLDILTEGASLDIIVAGNYVNVTTESGVTGWLNSKYCKGK